MSEFEWIDRYLKPLVRSPGAQGLSNDVAELGKGASSPLIVTLDTLVAGIHFLTDDPLDTVARKLIRVNVSDILCKGALPREALLSIAFPKHLEEAAFATFCDGLGADLDAWNIDLLGGDTVSTAGPLTLSLTLTGECLGRGPLFRSGASPGDILVVSGWIGQGVLGLEDARKGRDTDRAAAYRTPQLAPLEAAELVARFASASIDVSDGLLSDARHIASQSGHCIHIDLERVPLYEPVEALDQRLHLVTGGDDYQILMTVKPGDIQAFQEAAGRLAHPFSVIGAVRAGEGLTLSYRGQPVPVPARAGFSH